MRTLWLIFLTLSFGLQAEDPLSALFEHTRQLTTISGNFQQSRTLSKINKTIRTEGEFQYSKSDGLNWITTAPIQTHLLITPRGVWRVKGEKKERVKGIQQYLQKSILQFFQVDRSKLVWPVIIDTSYLA